MGRIRKIVLNNVPVNLSTTKAVGMQKCGVFEQISANWIYVVCLSLSLIENGRGSGFCDEKRDGWFYFGVIYQLQSW
jgi:hypothetical protein